MEAEVLTPLELSFSDLLFISSGVPPLDPGNSGDFRRRESLFAAVTTALGPSGPGLLAVSGVPGASTLRSALLPLARKLAILSPKERAKILKEHGLGSDVSLKNPDRSVSSFALQLKCTPSTNFESSGGLNLMDAANQTSEGLHDCTFKHLGGMFKELGLCMMNLGLRVAQICDRTISHGEIAESIMESCSVKGRLIHYHSMLDKHIIKESPRSIKGRSVQHVEEHSHTRNTFSKSEGNGLQQKQDRCTKKGLTALESSAISSSDLWQQWHYDYGLFTVLTAPMFLFSCSIDGCSCNGNGHECLPPNGHTSLQLFDSVKNKILLVKTSPECFIVQVGESGTILSGGQLHSTLHSVGRPRGAEGISRETFVVFLQPAWNKVLSPKGLMDPEQLKPSLGDDVFCASQACCMQEVSRKIPSLSSRFRDGMTFAEFSRETTMQYYSSNGTQPKNY